MGYDKVPTEVDEARTPCLDASGMLDNLNYGACDQCGCTADPTHILVPINMEPMVITSKSRDNGWGLLCKYVIVHTALWLFGLLMFFFGIYVILYMSVIPGASAEMIPAENDVGPIIERDLIVGSSGFFMETPLCTLVATTSTLPTPSDASTVVTAADAETATVSEGPIITPIFTDETTCSPVTITVTVTTAFSADAVYNSALVSSTSAVDAISAQAATEALTSLTMDFVTTVTTTSTSTRVITVTNYTATTYVTVTSVPVNATTSSIIFATAHSPSTFGTDTAYYGTGGTAASATGYIGPTIGNGTFTYSIPPTAAASSADAVSASHSIVATSDGGKGLAGTNTVSEVVKQIKAGYCAVMLAIVTLVLA